MGAYSTVLPEAVAHCCTEAEIRALLKNLQKRGSNRLGTHGYVVALQRAIEYNDDGGVVRALLEQPETQVNAPIVGPDGNTALHIAVFLRRKVAVRLLLNCQGLDPNRGNRRRDTALHLVAKATGICCEDLADILELLLNDPRVNLSALDDDLQTAFHVACKREENFDYRQSHRGSNSAQSGFQAGHVASQLLRSAVEKGLTRLCHFLKQRDALGRIGLHYAAENGMYEVVSKVLNELGLQSRDVSELVLAQDNRGRVPVHLAAQRGHLAVVQLLLPFGYCTRDQDGLTTLHYAVKSGRQDIVEALFLNVPQHDTNLETALAFYLELLNITTHHNTAIFLLTILYSYVVDRGFSSLLHWAVEHNDALGHGALLIGHYLRWSPDKANEFLDPATEHAALHIAVMLENLNAVKALCSESGWYLNANQRDKNSNTALHYAFECNNKEICRVLMQRPDVKEHLSRLHKYRETYVIAANAILVVAVLIATLTYVRCPTVVEAAAIRQAGKSNKFRPGDTLVVTRIAFLFAMTSTILGAFAALPFSFGFFFVQTVGDDYVGKSVKRTRTLIVLASYFLVLSLGAVVFAFICSQYVSPHLDCDTCELACMIVLGLFVALSVVFVVTNLVRCCMSKRRRAKSPTGWRPLMGV